MKSLIVTFLIVLQLALQIGVPVHTHFCEMDGTFTSVLFKVEHQCTEPHTDLPPCCQKEKPKKDCCSDEVKVIKTTVDQIHSYLDAYSFQQLLFINNLPFDFNSSPLFVNVETEGQATKHKRPPPLWRTGRHIQTLHQTWQI